MLSKLPWQKRSSRTKSQSGISFSPNGYPSSQSDPLANSISPASSPTPESQPQPHRRILSRARSQRFFSAPVSEQSKNNRHSYLPPGAQTAFSNEELPDASSSIIASHRELANAQSALHSESQSPPNLPNLQLYTSEGNDFEDSLSPVWTPGQLLPDAIDNIFIPSPQEPEETSAYRRDPPEFDQMSGNGMGKSSSEGVAAGFDNRWTQRRLQRLNTEQGFREQRQNIANHGQPPIQVQVQSQLVSSQSQGSISGDQYAPEAAAHQQAQAVAAYQTQRTQNTSPYLAQSSSPAPTSGSPAYYSDAPQSQYSPPDANPPYQNHTARQLQQARSFNTPDDTPIVANTPTATQPKTRHTNRQSVHNNGIVPVNAQPASPMPQTTQAVAAQQTKEVEKSTPQLGEDMSEDDVNQLIRDHKELREKYTKVKKYYFEKEDQVKQLQNSLAHQRIAQSRTSLDDTEYATRFNRLDGLIAQLSFSIRKSWRSVPSWLAQSINKDAVMTGKQEMTAVGRAIISHWLVEEVFDRYFHPDIDIVLSAQLKAMQKTIRRNAPPAQSQEDEDYLTSKVVNWRLTTLEGLQEMLRSQNAAANRAHLTETLKGQLINSLQMHLDNPPMSDLDGGVHMIIELAVAMASHLPLESRDVQIEYFLPGQPINPESMKPESGIPSLNTSISDELAERASLRSAASDMTDGADKGEGGSHSKRGMLSALTGGGKKREPAQGKHAGAGGSSSSLANNVKEDSKVRMAVGIAAHVRGRTVLVKAPVFAMP